MAKTPSKGKKRQKKSMKLPITIIGIIAAVLVVAMGVVSLGINGGEGYDEKKIIEQLPDYAKTNLLVQKAYVFATTNPEVLSKVPCYCGCNQFHMSVGDCFRNENGVYDRHGANCQLCININQETAKMYGEGMSMKEIRSIIENKYEGKYAQGTDTPPV